MAALEQQLSSLVLQKQEAVAAEDYRSAGLLKSKADAVQVSVMHDGRSVCRMRVVMLFLGAVQMQQRQVAEGAGRLMHVMRQADEFAARADAQVRAQALSQAARSRSCLALVYASVVSAALF